MIKEGIITSFVGGIGEILSTDNISYMFTENETKEEIKIGDKVSFRGEITFGGTYKAFFIKKIKEEKNNE